MQMIQEITEFVEEEIEDAKKYAKMALQYREERNDLALIYNKMSEEEMGHMMRLHDIVTVLIKDYRAKNGEPPPDMMAVYNYLHNKHMEKAAEVKSLQSLFRK